MAQKAVLQYIGDGSAIPNIPARDLTAGDLESEFVVEYGGKMKLIQSGLYKEAGGQVARPSYEEAPSVRSKKSVTED